MNKKISILLLSFCLHAHLLGVEENKNAQDVHFMKNFARRASWHASMIGWIAVSLPLVIGLSDSILRFGRLDTSKERIALTISKISNIYSEHFDRIIVGSGFILAGQVLNAYAKRIEKPQNGVENSSI